MGLVGSLISPLSFPNSYLIRVVYLKGVRHPSLLQPLPFHMSEAINIALTVCMHTEVQYVSRVLGRVRAR